MKIGVMQGRLVPPIEGRFQCFPRHRWAEEFPAAEQAGLSAIEWIYDVFGAGENPLANDSGIERIQSLSVRHNVAVRSVCADYFMDLPLLRATASEVDERLAVLRWLFKRCRTLSVARIVLPFVDASRIETAEEIGQVIDLLDSVIETAEETNIELHLETSLPPESFAALLKQIPHPLVKANFDSGNSASLGYDVREEFQAYGDRIGSVHIKDRVLGGVTVPLGYGDANLEALFDELNKIGWNRDVILQVARSTPGDEVAWARQNREFVEKMWLTRTKSN
jgi:hexulose-6-phosphate isomerase